MSKLDRKIEPDRESFPPFPPYLEKSKYIFKVILDSLWMRVFKGFTWEFERLRGEEMERVSESNNTRKVKRD